MRRLRNFGALLALGLMTGCGEQEVILPGERLDLRAVEGEAAIEAEAVNRALPIVLSPAVANPSWTHKNGSVSHRTQHPALSASLTPVWSADIGAGNSRKHRITADPVVADGRVFTLDSRARVTAVTTGGAAVWTRDLTPSADRADDASGGGLAYATGRLYATTAFGELFALDAASGQVLWEQDLDAAATGAPTVFEGIVYVVTRNALGWAIDANTGRILWQVLGAPSDSGVAGGPAPAIAGSLAVFPFSSGQMISAERSTGTQVWSASVVGSRIGRAFSRISDLAGDPVYSGDVIYSGNHSGRAAAFDATTGERLWTAEEGAMSPVWLDGGSLFLISDENRLVRLDAATGETIWAVDLPFFTRQRIARRKGTYAHFGPVLAGGRLLVASDDGVLRQYDPVDGGLIGAVPLPTGAARNPVVAQGTLYLVTEDGRLHAFR